MKVTINMFTIIDMTFGLVLGIEIERERRRGGAEEMRVDHNVVFCTCESAVLISQGELSE
jgi:hypothetical protein